MIIGILNGKGGVGKTTLSLLLAEDLRRRYGTVEVWDADMQGSASDWAAGAAATGDPLQFKVEPVNLASLRHKPETTDFTVIDTPPGNSAAMDAAANRSDFVVIPTDTSPMDLKRAAATLGALHVPAALLFYATNRRTQLFEAAMAWVNEADVSAFDAVVPPREDAKKIVDTGITWDDLFTIPSVTDELLEAAGEK